eukprot:12606257-Alexandrium_andersonii.AAC.1
MLRPLVCPEVPGFCSEKRMEVRLIAPGAPGGAAATAAGRLALVVAPAWTARPSRGRPRTG